MFHLLVKYNGWAKSRDTIALERTFEYSDDAVSSEFKLKDKFQIEKISRIPALFISETHGSGSQIGHVGTIARVTISGKEVNLEYHFDERLTPIPNSIIEKLAGELDIRDFEFTRTHWAIKDRDLFEVILRSQLGTLPRPKVFKLHPESAPDPTLLAVMMPFLPKFDEVNSTFQAVAKSINMQCLRADDIWEEEAVIQDIVSLISRARIVIADCTGRNPNVFYEVGIAHALGRDVILVAQSEEDIPFDLRHLRFVHYLNNNEGRANLAEKLKKRISTLLSAT